MLPSCLQILPVAVLAAVANAASTSTHHRHNSIRSSYDYVIVGGGASGLAVANRLSEDCSVSVLVIEAGPFGQGEDYISVPGMSTSAPATKYDWNLTFTPNSALNDRVLSSPQGKVVGGGTVINRLVLNRGSRLDYDRWQDYGAEGWNWDSLFEYMKKSETYTSPSDDIVASWGVEEDMSVHRTGDVNGTGVHSTYSSWIWPLTENIVNATQELGIAIPVDQAAGSPIGGYWCPHNMHPDKATRTSAREAYYDPVQRRPNLHLLASNQVTRLIGSKDDDGLLQITGVEYAASADAPRATVGVEMEAIMAAGAPFTPAILQVSGIGDRSHLDSIGVETLVDLAAVGQNWEDHVLLVTTANITTDQIARGDLSTDSTFAAAALDEYYANLTGPYSTPSADFILFLPLENFTSAETAAAIQAEAEAQNATAFLPEGSTPEVAAGYAREHGLLTDHLRSQDQAVMEFIWDDGTIVVGLQKPFSKGSVRAASCSTFDLPLVDSGYLRNPLDVRMLVEAVKFTRTLRETAAVAALSPRETAPGPEVVADADIEGWIRDSALTFYHGVASCRMGPREEGGCVDAETLVVYGTGNLRVVDASVIPMLPATHIMTTVWGVAEKAADIIKSSARA